MCAAAAVERPDLALLRLHRIQGADSRDRGVSARVVDIGDTKFTCVRLSRALISIQFMREVANTICASVCAHIAEAKVYVGGHRGNKGRKQNESAWDDLNKHIHTARSLFCKRQRAFG